MNMDWQLSYYYITHSRLLHLKLGALAKSGLRLRTLLSAGPRMDPAGTGEVHRKAGIERA